MNNRKFKLLAGAVACVVTLSSGSIYAETKTPVKTSTAKVQVTGLKEREAASELAGLLSGITTLSASFEQQTLDDSGRRLQESKGDMVLKRPNLFRWNVTSPFPQEVVSDGSRVSYYDKDLDQLTLQDIDTRTSATPAVLLSGDAAKMLEGFTVTLSQSGKERFFTLLPKGQDNSFEELQLSFHDKTLREMMLTDTLGSRTRISFLNPKVNEPVKEKMFELYVPPGVDVIDQTSVALKGNSGTNTSKP
ncbi:outer membrane lipoprotein chaperone LolA [Sansalvadorimonas sp. 2012CJ34-2]|uniref:Outer-membrane lipoprotein carrier protein n=1 Tax=Parendozoicomonas callyspongiae TaxID=2942213 RepID=A0ABT0PBN5_9GAMM|nr:outer membrane lipoprotein chaperone LolA [Sansalvadorimonas sp. 2012CJ34-2]MCL6268794.1 outer membrane lipoprotein chaperone LolA [Sansalvadorimonas sp. 2012CJ34-2]